MSSSMLTPSAAVSKTPLFQSIEPNDSGSKVIENSILTESGKPPEKANHGQQYLGSPSINAGRNSIDTLSDNSTYSADNENERRTGGPHTFGAGTRGTSRSPAPIRTWRGRWEASWSKNKGLVLVMLSQLFGALMNVTTRLLETDGSHGKGMHPFQILFVRMGITAILSCIYMWYAKVPHAPLGMREVRGLLLARGIGGFFGVYGVYYSLIYLPIAEATVLTFLAPIVACWACSLLIHETFTRMEQIAALVSLLGVILIAQPTSLFSSSSSSKASPGPVATDTQTTKTTASADGSDGSHMPDDVSPAQRMTAVGVAMIGVLGAACAYTTIRWIGKRAHPLISVNYFACLCTVVSTLSLLFLPGIGFRLPSSLIEWAYLFFLGICGFVMQFLLTAGLQHEKGSRATNMIYTQMLFALAFDKLVWDSTPGVASLVGSSLILGSAVYVAVQKNSVGQGRKAEDGDQERGLVDGMDAEDEEQDGGRGPLRGVQEVQLRTLRV